jgi:hypothetical protein
VLLGVDAAKLLGCGRRSLDPLKAEPGRAIERRLDRPQASRVLGVASGVVLQR